LINPSGFSSWYRYIALEWGVRVSLMELPIRVFEPWQTTQHFLNNEITEPVSKGIE
jgi:hypothetical protein